MNRDLQLFRSYETAIQQITDRYPEPSEFTLSPESPTCNYVRQQIKKAIELYVDHPMWESTVSRNKAELVLRAFVFSVESSTKLYIGPRKTRKTREAELFTRGQDTDPSIPPIDCTDLETFRALCHLKALSLLPINIIGFNISAEKQLFAEESYPNVELIPQQTAGHFLIL